MVKLVTKRLTITLLSVFVVVAGLILPLSAFSQVTTANLEGTVVDEKGNPTPDIEVVARNQATGYYQIVYSAETGKYRIPFLPPGKYSVRASGVSYNVVTKTDVSLTIGQTTTIDFALTSNAIQQKEVVVEGRAPLIDTKKSDISVTVLPDQIASLPLNSRNFLELAQVAPGAKTSTGGRGPVTTGAVNSRFISAYIDGGEFKSDGLGGVVGTSFGFTTNVVPEDAISEFQVITSMYKAEYSDASSGVINAITKSGGNEVHGSAFSYFRAQGLNARGAFETTKPNFNRQQMGVSVGGPIVVDQTHFFVSYERDNINNYTVVNNGGIQSSLEGTFLNPTTENLLLARLTHEFSQTNSLDVRYLYVNTGNTPGNFGGLAAQSNGFNLKFYINSLVATDRWLIGNSAVNELRVHYQHYYKDASPASTDPEYTYTSSGISTGWNPNQPQNEDYRRLQLRDDVTFMVPNMSGSHAFKAGVSLEREPLASKAEFDKGAVFQFRTDTSSAPFQGIVGLGNAQTSVLNYKYGIYAQDDWTVAPKLTLNLGLRWDVETNMINNGYVNPLAGDTALTNHVPSDYIGNGNRAIDYGRIAPRVGFAWDVMGDHSTAIHGGFGIFYDRFIYNLTSNEQQNVQYNIYTVRFSSAVPATTSRDQLISYVQQKLGGAPAPGVTLLPNSVSSPYTRQMTLGVATQVTPALSASLDYVQIRGFNEYTTYNVNYQKGIGGPRVATSAYAGIALLTSAGKSWYDAMQFSLTRPYDGDWQMQLSYTLSWAYNTFDDPFQGYALQSSIVKAPSLQDERHHLVLSGIVNLPYEVQMSGLITLGSPRPYTSSGAGSVTTGTDDNADGITGDDYPGGPSGRNSQRPSWKDFSYWYRDVDLRLTKYVGIVGTNKIAVFAEAFNVFNWVNYGSYFTIINQKNKAGTLIFGTPSSAYAARQVQLGARVMF
jgi:hypothetical protein